MLYPRSPATAGDERQSQIFTEENGDMEYQKKVLGKKGFPQHNLYTTKSQDGGTTNKATQMSLLVQNYHRFCLLRSCTEGI